MKLAFILISLLLWIPAQGHDLDDSSCNQWTMKQGVSCIFASSDGYSWERTCYDENQLCKYQQKTPCLKEKVCWNDDPNSLDLAKPCSDWVKHHGVKCRNKESGKWEQAWRRACTVANMEETLCSNNL